MIILGAVGFLVERPGALAPPSGGSGQAQAGCATEAISDGSLLSAYQANAASADSEYTGRIVCVSGSVDGVESYGGGYSSCVYQPQLPPSQRGVQLPGCTGMSQYSAAYRGSLEWVEFAWASQSAAGAVSPGASFAARCHVDGVQNQVTLVLGGCTVR